MAAGGDRGALDEVFRQVQADGGDAVRSAAALPSNRRALIDERSWEVRLSPPRVAM